MFDRNISSCFKSTKLFETKKPSIFECAALSLDVYYKPGDADRPALPPGWIRFKESGNTRSGYYGAFYIKNLENPVCAVFAHRGTVLNELGTIIGDIEVGLNRFLFNTPLQFESTQKFVIESEMAFIQKYPDVDPSLVDCVHTGHSLGAILADLMATAQSLPAITFENPGSKPIIVKLLRESHIPVREALDRLSKLSQVYQADVNLINTCNEQVGKVFQLISKPYDYAVWDRGPYIPIDSNFILNPYYLGYTLDQHKLIKILHHLEVNDQIEQISNPPAGFNNGYIAYLDYETRSEYWEGYATIIWNKRPDLQDEFNHDINQYLIEFCNQLRLTQRAARERAKLQHDFGLYNEELFLSSTVAKINIPQPTCQSDISVNKFGLFSRTSNSESMEVLSLSDKNSENMKKEQDAYKKI